MFFSVSFVCYAFKPFVDKNYDRSEDCLLVANSPCLGVHPRGDDLEIGNFHNLDLLPTSYCTGFMCVCVCFFCHEHVS